MMLSPNQIMHFLACSVTAGHGAPLLLHFARVVTELMPYETHLQRARLIRGRFCGGWLLSFLQKRVLVPDNYTLSTTYLAHYPFYGSQPCRLERRVVNDRRINVCTQKQAVAVYTYLHTAGGRLAVVLLCASETREMGWMMGLNLGKLLLKNKLWWMRAQRREPRIPSCC